ncbi:MAG TPA: P-loop NTPase [Clostridia bacterium]|nr:P-loop NTPase [Clostridia bacterium]
MLEQLTKRINIVTGHYGSGKTNLSVNLAKDLNRSGKKVSLVDLDIVNPYFRAADLTKELEAEGIRVIAPIYANSNLDIPALPPAIYSVFNDKTYTAVIDVGGDDAGAAALGRFSDLITEENDFDHFYVINARRILTQTPEETVVILKEIEKSSRIPVTALVNNTNLSKETDAGVVRASCEYARRVSELSGLKIKFTSVRKDIAAQLGDLPDCGGPVYPVDIDVQLPWD